MAQKEPEVIKQMKASGLEIMYALFLGLIIALFFGLGISAFYEAPKAPQYPTTSVIQTKEVTEEQIQAEKDYEKSIKAYEKESATYNRNVSMIALALAVLAMTISLAFLGDIFVMANGVLLGGVFTLIYSMIRGFMSEDTKYRFIIVCVGLVITLALGYLKFIKKPNLPKAK